MNKDSKMLAEAYEQVAEETLKTFFVSLDKPGAGWSTYVKAKTKEKAVQLATKKYGEAPDTVSEVEPDQEEKEKAQAEQQRYDELGAERFMIALYQAGVLNNIEEAFKDKKMVIAIKNFINLYKRINPHIFKEVAEYI